MDDKQLESLIPVNSDTGKADYTVLKHCKQGYESLSHSEKEGLTKYFNLNIENKKKGYPYLREYCLAILKSASQDQDWVFGRARSALTDIVSAFGYSRSDITRITGALTKQHLLNAEESDAANWFGEQSLSNQHELSKLDEKGFSKAWVELSEWGEKPVKRDDLRKLVSQHPGGLGQQIQGRRPGFQKRQQAPAPPAAPVEASDDSLVVLTDAEYDSLASKPSTPQPPQSTADNPGNEDLIGDLISILNRLDVDAVYGDEQQQERLQAVQTKLELLNDLVSDNNNKRFKPQYV